jgi:hypothetical protein
MTKTPEEIAEDCNEFFKTYITGDASKNVAGIRRRRPQGRERAEDSEEAASEIQDEHPLPEIDGTEVDISSEEEGGGSEGGVIEHGVVFDIIPFEYAQAVVDPPGGSTIVVQIVFCINYPPECLSHLIGENKAKYQGKRIVVFPCDYRFHIWVYQCLDLMYRQLGEDHQAADFYVWIREGRFEDLRDSGLTFPEAE